MGSLRRSKSTPAKSGRRAQRPSSRRVPRKAIKRTAAKVHEIPPGVQNEIENQRFSLVTVITLLHCLHVVLLQQEDHVDQGLDLRITAALKSSSLPSITAMLLDRTHTVLHALDLVNLINASKAFKP
jgi:hypothetical protein